MTSRMDKKGVLTFAVIIIIALALVACNLKLPTAEAQTANSDLALTIRGFVVNNLNLTLDDVKAMPRTSEYAELYCVDNPRTPLNQGIWTGVELSYLIEQANLSAGAAKVAFFASDGYTTDLTIDKASQDSSILVAYQKDNESLDGLQLVVPYCWGYKWISSLTQIQLVNFDFLGTTESSGYSDDATAVNVGAVLPSSPSNPPYTLSTPNSTTPTQDFTPSPTLLPHSPTPTIDPKTSSVTSSPKLQRSSVFYVVIVITIIIFTIVSTIILMKQSKLKN
ncbi:MAG TPA: molybdopterin-dependent oxidoreductase [Candidatus Acidoferrum sp.]|nr:molybdopterin-dependent oxidoreductase [Candidatus Acidoferrum sp.]